MRTLINAFKGMSFFLSLFLLVLMPGLIIPSIAANTPGKVSAEKERTWKEEWDQVVAAAKKEGELSIYGGGFIGIKPTMADVFKQKFGITLNILTLSASEAVEKISREQRTGTSGADVITVGQYGVQVLLKPQGLIKSLNNIVILPEALDDSKWIGGKFPWVDAQHFQAQYGGIVESGIWRNTALTSQNDIKKYSDLLNPKWKGKIIMQDPTLPGPGSVWFRLYYPVLGEAYMKALINQNPTVLRDKRLEDEWLARGKNPILLFGETADLVKLKDVGSPIDYVETMEGEYLGTGPGSVAISANAPHPNTAKVFINWLLTREGQTVWSEAQSFPSFRVDVPLGKINPVTARKAGKLYLADTVKSLMQSDEYNKISKRIFAPIVGP